MIKRMSIAILILLSFNGITEAGTNEWTTNGPHGASIRALAIDPSSPDTLYAGTDNGVYKSADGGTTWSAVNNGLPSHHYFYSLAINPLSPDTLYAGTDGDGVYKSADGGTSWSAVNNGLPSDNVYALAIDPSSPDTLYAGTDGSGVYKSTDGGATWSAVNNGLDDLLAYYVYSLAIDPSSPDTLYAGTREDTYKSTNGGASWSAVNIGFSYDVYALAIDPSSPDTLYAGTDDGVYKSSNGGASWISISNDNGWIAGYIYALAINPSTNTLYAAKYGGVYQIKLMADLIVTRIRGIPARVERGGSFIITDRTKNEGLAKAERSKTRYYLSTDTNMDLADRRLRGRRRVRAIDGGKASRGRAKVTIPFTTPAGLYYVIGCADDKNDVVESEEGNNCRASQTRVKVKP